MKLDVVWVFVTMAIVVSCQVPQQAEAPAPIPSVPGVTSSQTSCLPTLPFSFSCNTDWACHLQKSNSSIMCGSFHTFSCTVIGILRGFLRGFYSDPGAQVKGPAPAAFTDAAALAAALHQLTA